MEIFWYSIILAVVCLYFVLDGYDFGVGIIHLFFPKTETEKRLVAKTAGFFWDFNEVFLVVAGGLLFMAFPLYYASVFSGFYLPLIILLWLMIFRAIGLEFRNQFSYLVWRNFWDKSFGIASLLLSLFSGAALGNIVRGVNLGQVKNGVSYFEPAYFFLPLWNNKFSPLHVTIGVLDWFTLLIAIIAVLILTIHGANWIILKTHSSLIPKLKKYILIWNGILAVLLVVSLFLWHLVNPHFGQNFEKYWWMNIFPLLFLTGFFGMFYVSKIKNPIWPFLFSTSMISMGIISTFLSIYPSILPSTNTLNPDLTIYNTASSFYSLSVAVPWLLFGILLLLTYVKVQKSILSGKIEVLPYDH